MLPKKTQQNTRHADLDDSLIFDPPTGPLMLEKKTQKNQRREFHVDFLKARFR